MHEQAPAPTSLGIDEGVSEAASTESNVTEVMETAGRFRVYLGAAPGVGKTFAMFSEGQRRREDGIDVVVGYAECHGRPPTEALLDGLEIVPYREVAYRGMPFRRWISTQSSCESQGSPSSMSSRTRSCPARGNTRSAGRRCSSFLRRGSTSSRQSTSSTSRALRMQLNS